ncbi:MAG: MiaB/RimO family radical SAM methylthiotransferase [Firmicutes bacterium]|nr:MiaB/RimO family radical SAM methylthiotransferase [Bacillota bacterium]
MKKAIVYTLGCKVNQCESQQIINMLGRFGYEVCSSFMQADLYIINSCSVTNEADKKSRQAIAKARKFNENAIIIMIGCSVEKGYENNNNIITIGTKNKVEELRNYIKNICKTNVCTDFSKNKMRPMIKIQDGCNRFCSYCIVPYLRGRSVSRPVNEIISEINQYKDKTKEIVLVGIDISSYDNLIGLIKELGINSKNNFRFRLGSLECSIITHEFLTELKENNFCEHFHLSLQSGSDSVLKRMNRHYTAKTFLEKVNLIRKYFPLAAITTDIITGFPNETEKEFNETLDLITQAKFSNIHAFPFSAREGTKAYDMDGQISHQLKKERANKIIERAKDLQKEFLQKNVGLMQEVFVEEDAGYTRNYIRVRTNEKIGMLIKIKLSEGDIYYE